jgi:hypothetical protein
MPIKLECPNCHRKLSVADAMAGKRGRCPACREFLTIPGAASAPTPAQPQSSKANPAAPRAPAPAGPPPLPAPKGDGLPPPSGTDLEAEAAAALVDRQQPQAAPTILKFECEYCFEPVQLPADMAGKRAPCPSCRRIIKVPEPAKDKKDWRSAAAGVPSAAKLADGPPPEGAWDTRATSRVSEEALEEAGVLPDKTPGLTWGQKITRGVLLAAVCGLGIWGALTLANWWQAGKEQRALKKGLDFAASKDAPSQASPEALAALYGAALDFYARTGNPSQAQEQFNKGFGLLAADPAGGMERDLALIDLAQRAVQLGGSVDEVGTGGRLSWDEVQKDVIAALKAVQDPVSRQEGLRLLGRELIERKQTKYASPLPGRVFTVPAEQLEGQARLLLELHRAGGKAEVETAAHQVIDSFQARQPARPSYSPSILALALLLEKEKELAPVKEEEARSELIGKAEGEALQNKWEDARKRIGAEPSPGLRLQALVGLAAIALDKGQGDSKDLDKALELAKEGQIRVNKKDVGEISWAQKRLVDLGLKAGRPEDSLQPVADAIAEPSLRGRAQLALLRSRLAHSSQPADEKLLETVDPNTVASALAHLALIQHNVRRGAAWEKTVQSWQEPNRAFGFVGAALGLQGKKD